MYGRSALTHIVMKRELVKIDSVDEVSLSCEPVYSQLTHLQLMKILESLPFLLLKFDADRNAIDVSRTSLQPDLIGDFQGHVLSIGSTIASGLIDSEVLKGSVARPGVIAQLTDLLEILQQPQRSQLEAAITYILYLAFPGISLSSYAESSTTQEA